MISKRLSEIIDLIPQCDLLLDVGTDHGYVPIEAVKRGIAKKALATDVNHGPLERAGDNVEREGLEDFIKLKQSDGLKSITEDFDAVVISGMGGDLMAKIIREGSQKIGEHSMLILQPQSNIPEFRTFLHESGFMILKEKWVMEQEKYYVIITAQKGEEKYEDPVFYRFGKSGLEDKDPCLASFLKKEKIKFKDILEELLMSDAKATHIKRVEDTLKDIEHALMYLEDG